MINIKVKKIISLILIIFIFSNYLFFTKPQKTEAFLGFGDTVMEVGGNLFTNLYNTVKTTISAAYNRLSSKANVDIWYKEYVLDPVTWVLKDVILHQIVASTIDWINNGFEGNPAYITDFGGYLEFLGDEVIGEYVYGSNLNFLCSPFALDVKSALMVQYYRGKIYQPRCTLSEVTNNIEGAVDDLSNEWNWDVWNSMTQTSTNNPFGQFIDASLNISNDIKNKADMAQIKLGWADGFLSYESCDEVEVCDATGCRTKKENCTTQTPGTVLKSITNNSLNVGSLELISADEMSEIVGALLSQLVQKVAGPDGLLSSSKSSGGNKSYLNEMSSYQGNIILIRENVLKEISNALKVEKSFNASSKQTLTIITNIKNKFDNIGVCYVSKGKMAEENLPTQKIWNSEGKYLDKNEADQRKVEVDNIIEKQVQPIVDEYTTSDELINELTIIKNKIENSSDPDSINSGIAEFSALKEDDRLHDVGDVAENDARNTNLDNNLGYDEITDLNDEAVLKSNECNSYILTSDPNNN
jgi:hypothetical protein